MNETVRISFKNILFAFVCMIIFTSCNDSGNTLEKTMQLAGSNKVELEKVLAHFKKKDADSLKLKAAYFLISNMPGHYSLDTTSLHIYRPILYDYDSLIKHQKRYPSFQYAEILKGKWSQLNGAYDFRQTIYGKPVLADIATIKADYLINHIERAFTAWHMAQEVMDISFETFCEYILPYRKKDGVSLENWLPYFKSDSLKRSYVLHKRTVETMVDSIIYQYSEFKPRGIKHTRSVLTDFPYLKIGDLLISKRATCEVRCWFNTLLLSSLGIPSGFDYVPAWGNKDNRHYWNSIILNNKKSLAFESYWDRERWKYKSLYNNINSDKVYGSFRLPKVFRYSYASQPSGPYRDERMKVEDIPPFFRTDKQKDVSSEYFTTSNVEVTLSKPLPENTFYLWICVYNNAQWKPVQWAELKGKKAIFRDMGRDIVYMTGFYKNGEIVPVDNPFLLKSDGRMKLLNYINKNETIQIGRKFPPNPQLVAISKALIGSEIQVADNQNFINCKTIYKVSEAPKDYLNVIYPTLKHKYRYIRFLFPKPYLNIEGLPKGEDGFQPTEPRRLAEFVCFDKSQKNNIPVQGKILFSTGLDSIEASKCFDSKTLTFALPKNIRQPYCWLGLDLKFPKSIESVGFCPQTDRNNVLPGLTYELYYWDTDRWSSLGKQTAKTHSLIYQNVPKNVLLRLHCIDEGKEERPFIYENQQQIWR